MGIPEATTQPWLIPLMESLLSVVQEAVAPETHWSADGVGVEKSKRNQKH